MVGNLKFALYSLYVYYTYMTKKLTITVSDEVYLGLYKKIGARKIGSFVERITRPHVVDSDLANAYQDMAQDEEREAAALEWSEGLIHDTAHETR